VREVAKELIPMSIQPKFYRDAWWVFIHWKGERQKKRFGKGTPAKKAAELFAVKLMAHLPAAG